MKALPNHGMFVEVTKLTVMRDKKRIAIFAIVSLFTAGLLFGIYAVPRLIAGIDDAYAQWGAADMVVDYMREHDGEWPQKWSDLEPYFAKSKGRVGGWSFERFKSHVYIDFDPDVNELRADSETLGPVPFDVIRAASRWGSQFDGGPNEMLRSYFRDPGPDGDAAARAQEPDKPSEQRRGA